jgi:hypothetical protein
LFCLRQIDLLTLGKDVEQKDRDILPRIEGDDPIAPTLAFAASPKPHLACASCARHDLAGAGMLRDVVHNSSPFRVCQTKRFGITQVGWSFDNRLHEQSVRHCRSHGKAMLEPITRALANARPADSLDHPDAHALRYGPSAQPDSYLHDFLCVFNGLRRGL